MVLYRKESTGRKDMTKQNKWQEYEQRKQILFANSKSCEEYQRKLFKLIKELGI